MAEHQLIKPEVLVKTALGLLEDQVVVAGLVQRESVDQFKGAEDDTINVRVPGVLPHHEYAWRNDRSAEITFDELTETKVAVSFGGNVYSAVKVTDEQNDFDLESWAQVLDPQTRAVARGLERKALDAVTGQTYEVEIGKVEERGNYRCLVEARRVLNRFNAPDPASRVLLVGTDFEASLLNDEKFNRADTIGEAGANAALREATIGRLAGFRIVVSNEIDASTAYAFVPSAFVLATGAPSIPAGVSSGATTSDRNFALRWIRDYESGRMQERSVVNTYAGARSITDKLIGWDAATNREVISTDRHFVRGVKLTLAGADKYPAATTELAKITGVNVGQVLKTPTAG